MTIARAEPPYLAGEREMLDGWLEYHRATLLLKCEGITPEQLRRRSVPPSSMSLLGLVRHMADVERVWFRRCLGGEDAPGRYFSKDDPDGEFDNVDTADADEAFAAFRDECEHSRMVAARMGLDETGSRRGTKVSVRWVLTHMIEEYARHNGHADFLRERIDGATGD